MEENQFYTESDEMIFKYPLVISYAQNYAARIIQKTWKRYMRKITYRYLLDCSKEFEKTLTPKELSKFYPEFLEYSDLQMNPKLVIKMKGESFPPSLICKVMTEKEPFIDGKKHPPKWFSIFSSGKQAPIDQKALICVFKEAMHSKKEQH